MSKIIPINVAQTITEKVEDVGNSKDWAMVRTMSGLARPKPQKNLTPVEIHNVTRKTKLALILLPEWGVFFPPYNLSRLSAVARAAGYEVKVFDLNIEAYAALKGTLDFDPWDPSREFLWEQASTYFEQLHPHCEPVFRKFMDQIVEFDPQVLGFSLYYTNEQCSNWMANEFRSLLPHSKIIAGGPQASGFKRGTDHYYDHIIIGEGEQLLLTVLDSVEQDKRIETKVLVQPKTVRLDLDSLPFPDYTDYDFSKYTMPNGTSSEISRGCVAKCVFCTEVHFWKYRGRQAGTVLDEVEYQYKTHGIDFIWFIDSLVNGNLKELRAFALGVVEKKLPIQWQGYARCDDRMNLEYFKDLAASGCHMLNYGIESGSQRVLDDMKKNITREGVEANLRDGASVGIVNSTNWIIGFPSEQPQDLADTLTILYRIRNFKLLNVSGGVTMMTSPGAEVTDNPTKFGIDERLFQQAWTTSDLTNTKLHRMIRQKSFQIFAQHLNANEYVWGVDRPALTKMYELQYDKGAQLATIPYEQFDYNIIKPNISAFADSLVNEQWPLLRTLWRAMGAYTIELRHRPEEDLKEWGFRLACNYTATHKFSIDANGNWSADFSYNFIQEPDPSWAQFNWPDFSFSLDWQGQGCWVD